MRSPYRRPPKQLSESLSEIVALRGLAKREGDTQLAEIWSNVAGKRISQSTRVIAIKRGVLNVGVRSAPLLSELAAFQKTELLEALQKQHADLKIRDIKFVLQGHMKKRN
jgi:predicted nucleic acid-binding Zn ribbon protein